jgi:hypothetical protein
MGKVSIPRLVRTPVHVGWRWTLTDGWIVGGVGDSPRQVHEWYGPLQVLPYGAGPPAEPPPRVPAPGPAAPRRTRPARRQAG